MSNSEDELDTINDVNQDFIIKKQKETFPKLTKFERTKLLSERATQIANGSPIFVKGEFTSAYEIAEAELKKNVIPFIIKRKNGNTIELWKLKDFDLS